MTSRLDKLAGTDRDRLVVLQGRRERCRARTRFVLCRACNTQEHSNRDPVDICDDCLIDLWNARDIKAGAYEAGQKTGLVPMRISSRWHDLPYPRIAGDLKPDDDAPFARTYDERSGVESVERTLQHLYFEMLDSLARVLPCDPVARDSAEDAFAIVGLHCDGSPYGIETVALRLPREAHKAMMDLWRFVEWQSHAAYFEGFEAGRALLSGLALGTHTAEEMADEVAEKIERLRGDMEKSKQGRRRR